MDEFVIRPALPADAAHLRAAVVDLQDHEARLHPTRVPGTEMADAYLDWLKSRIGAGGAVFVAEENGTFAGFIAYWVTESHNPAQTPDSSRAGYISDLYVVPAYRGRHIARMLLASAERHLAAQGVRRLRIGTLANDDAARHAYEKAGLVPYEIIYEKPIGMALFKEIGGFKGLEPTRYGDWEHNGRCTDF